MWVGRACWRLWASARAGSAGISRPCPLRFRPLVGEATGQARGRAEARQVLTCELEFGGGHACHRDADDSLFAGGCQPLYPHRRFELVADGASGAGILRPMIDRAIGALLGLAAGDAVGTTLEFERPGTFTPIDDMVGG